VGKAEDKRGADRGWKKGTWERNNSTAFRPIASKEDWHQALKRWEKSIQDRSATWEKIA